MLPVFAAVFAVLTTQAPAGGLGLMTAAAPPLENIRAICAIGSARQPAGTPAQDFKWGDPTPVSVPGATTVSAQEANCVLERFKGAVLVADAAGDTSIGDAIGFRWISEPKAENADMKRLKGIIDRISGGRLDMPIVVYCHHTRCAYSYYVAQRMAQLGYTSVLWMREGTEAWQKAGYQFEEFGQNRWTGAFQKAVIEWRNCLDRQQATQITYDVRPVAEQQLAACRAEERRADAAVLEVGWLVGDKAARDFIARERAGHIGRVASQITTLVMRRRPADWYSRWGRLQGRPGEPTISGYEYCWGVIAGQGYGATRYYSTIYPRRISRDNEGNLELYNAFARNFASDNSDRFSWELERRYGGKPTGTGCYFARDKAAISKELEANLRGKAAISWQGKEI